MPMRVWSDSSSGAPKTPSISGVSFVAADGSSGYAVIPDVDQQGNLIARARTIGSGPYQGFKGLITMYTIDVTARTKPTMEGISESRLQRTLETVQIPLFQFGVFSDTDLSFHAGSNFDFGGRVHTNGMENFWSLLKRAIGGTYVSVDVPHLGRYVDEQVFRFNERGREHDGKRFGVMLPGVVGKRITYKELIGKDTPEGLASSGEVGANEFTN